MKNIIATLSLTLLIICGACKKEEKLNQKAINQTEGKKCYLTIIQYPKTFREFKRESIYDSEMNVIKVNVYDTSGKVIEYGTKTYNNGKLSRSQSGIGEYAEFEYQDNNLVRIKSFSYNTAGIISEDGVTEFEYGTSGKIIKQIRYSTGSSGKIVQNYYTWFYDEKGNVNKIKAFDYNDKYLGEVLYFFDNNKNFMKENPYTMEQKININNVIKLKVFDSQGNFKSEEISNYQYNEYGYPMKQILNDGTEIIFEYNCK